MSKPIFDHASASTKPIAAGQSTRSGRKGRFLLVAGAIAFVLLVIAYLDAGEEPIRPIVQHVPLSQIQEASQ